MPKILYHLLKINPRETQFERRGFICSKPGVRERLQHVGRSFLEGYHAALQESDQEELIYRLAQIEVEYQGFAFEGAAMGLALLDGLSPWNRERFSRFAAGPGKQHLYMLHVGAGWALARLPWLRFRIESAVRKFHPILRWLAIDGYGFHEGYFHWQTDLQPKIEQLSQDARHVFYQGLGRSLWFVNGADVRLIAQTIATFAPQFRGDAWSGIGLGCAYAGGMNRSELDELRWRAGSHGPALAQGAAFAAKARERAGIPASHTELACTALCGISTEEASALCDEALRQLNPLHACPYQQWRELLQQTLPLHGIFDRPPAWVTQLDPDHRAF
ncbi:MAG TPA: DUF1702 family protein [Candidatus Angelobacter sp.]